MIRHTIQVVDLAKCSTKGHRQIGGSDGLKIFNGLILVIVINEKLNIQAAPNCFRGSKKFK